MPINTPIPERLHNLLSTNSSETAFTAASNWAQNADRTGKLHHIVRELQLTENQLIGVLEELLVLVDSLEIRIAALEGFHP